MKKVLFITDGEAPYRAKFFDLLARKTRLDVLCECRTSKTRDSSWNLTENLKHNAIYLGEERYKNRMSVSVKMLEYILRNLNQYDEIIFGCVNTKPEMLSYMFLRFLGKNYSLNLDGETIFNDCGKKLWLKYFFLKGANKYYLAGEKAAKSLCDTLGKNKFKFYPYYFSSLTNDEIIRNSKLSLHANRSGFCLVVGRFFAYKGLDIAIQVAKAFPSIKFKFIGMGDRTTRLLEIAHNEKLNNVEIVPFLSKNELENEYLSCRFMLLPSRRECWGLVVNEALSYGTPVVSTWGSGASVEFLSDEYSDLLAEPDNAESLIKCVENFLKMETAEVMRLTDFLINKNMQYSIEKNVECYMKGINNE